MMSATTPAPTKAIFFPFLGGSRLMSTKSFLEVGKSGNWGDRAQ
jgi:hypothetical protein